MSREYRGYDEEARPPRRSGSPDGNLGRRPPRPRDEEGAPGYPPPRRSYGSGADMGGPPPRRPYGSGPDWPGGSEDERRERPPRRPRPARPDGEPEVWRRRSPRPGPGAATPALSPRGGKHQRLYRYLSLLGAMLFSSLGGITLSLNQLVVGILVLALSLPCAVLFWYF